MAVLAVPPDGLAVIFMARLMVEVTPRPLSHTALLAGCTQAVLLVVAAIIHQHRRLELWGLITHQQGDLW